MEILNSISTNDYVLTGAIMLVTALGYLAKILVAKYSKNKSIIVPASEIIDDVTDEVIHEIEDIKKRKDLNNPNIKDGFAVRQPVMEGNGVVHPVIMANSIIKQPSNPNKDEDNSADDEGG